MVPRRQNARANPQDPAISNHGGGRVIGNAQFGVTGIEVVNVYRQREASRVLHLGLASGRALDVFPVGPKHLLVVPLEQKAP